MNDTKKESSNTSSWLRIFSAFLAAGLLFALLLVALLPWYTSPSQLAKAGYTAASSSPNPPQVPDESHLRVVLREMVDTEIVRAEARLRDHFTLLLALAGLATTIILGGFTMTMGRRADQQRREMNEWLRESHEHQAIIRDAASDARDMLHQAKTITAEIEDYRSKAEQLSEEIKKESTQAKISPAVQNLAKEISHAQESQSVYLAAGIEEHNKKNYESSYLFFNKYLDSTPNDPWALSYAAVAAIEKARNMPQGDERSLLMAEAERRLRLSISLDPQIAATWANLGYMLVDRAEQTEDVPQKIKILDRADKKYRRALALDPQSGVAYNGLGIIFLHRVYCTEDVSKRNQFLAEAEKMLNEATKLGTKASYNFACLAALRGQEEKSREYLEVARTDGSLPSRSHLITDKDMDPLRIYPWFKEILEAAPE